MEEGFTEGERERRKVEQQRGGKDSEQGNTPKETNGGGGIGNDRRQGKVKESEESKGWEWEQREARRVR